MVAYSEYRGLEVHVQRYLKAGEGRRTMLNVLDVAQDVLNKQGGMSTWKLQKLVYYCQAWSLVWDEEALYTERIEAWANGPVVRKLYSAHRGLFQVTGVPGGDARKLKKYQRETVDAVLKLYGKRSGRWLSDLTHREKPWRDARKAAGLTAGERGSAVITQGALSEYYGSL